MVTAAVVTFIIIIVLVGLLFGLSAALHNEQQVHQEPKYTDVVHQCEDCGRAAIHWCETCGWYFCDPCWNVGHLCVNALTQEWKVVQRGWT